MLSALPHDYRAWTPYQVAHWLNSIGLTRWADAFQRHHISGNVLGLLDELLEVHPSIPLAYEVGTAVHVGRHMSRLLGSLWCSSSGSSRGVRWVPARIKAALRRNGYDVGRDWGAVFRRYSGADDEEEEEDEEYDDDDDDDEEEEEEVVGDDARLLRDGSTGRFTASRSPNARTARTMACA